MSQILPQMNLPVNKISDSRNGAVVSTPAYNGLMSGGTSTSRLYQPTNAVGALGTSVQIVDFVTNNYSDLHQWQNCELEITLVNTDGADAISLLPVFNLLQQYQFMVGGSTTTLLYPNYMTATYYATNTNMQIQTGGPALALPKDVTTTYAPTTIAAGASVTLYLPFDNFMFLTQGVLLPEVRTECRHRFYFNNASSWVTSTSAAPGSALSIQSVQLLARGIIYKPAKLIDLIAGWNESTHVFPCVAPTLKNIGIGALSNAALSGKQVLNCVSGIYCGLIAQLFDQNGAVNETYMTPKKMKILQFYYAMGSQVNFYNSDISIRLASSKDFPQSQMFVAPNPTSDTPGAGNGFQSGSYFLSFCANFNNCLQQCGTCEGLSMSGFESVAITPQTTLVNGRLDIYLCQLSCFSVLPLSGLVTFTNYVSQAA